MDKAKAQKKLNKLKRGVACFVQEAGVKLRFPQTTISSAVVLAHRMMVQDVVQSQKDVELLSQSCLLIASKTTETPTRVRDVVNVVYKMTHPPPSPPLEIGSEYKKIKEEVIAYEHVVLRSIGFHVNLELPYNYLLNYAKSMQLDTVVVKTAWSLVNDGLINPSFALHSHGPSAAAVAAIYLALEILRESEFEMILNLAPKWWDCFQVSLEQIRELYDLILEVYEETQQGEPLPNINPRAFAGDWDHYLSTLL
eukprot:TRINITY_DN11509_c0_g1_i1.p1 TRINITY_DN11509_c0_g1~~TRINITY_DN11509_c0_g1_i1.p1  ORF type:complete len:265 (+),score=36.97 TRINITY_DN11509_c0_g1_i1:37-795(+)